MTRDKAVKTTAGGRDPARAWPPRPLAARKMLTGRGGRRPRPAVARQLAGRRRIDETMAVIRLLADAGDHIAQP